MKHKGFSLVEILVAMSLALLLVMGTAELITLSLQAKKKGDLTSGLAHAASARFEGLKALAFDDPAFDPGEYAAELRDGISLETLIQEWVVAEAGDGLKRVILVTRPADHPESELRLVLFLSNDLGFRP